MVSGSVQGLLLSAVRGLTGRVEFEVFLQVGVSEVALFSSVRNDASELEFALDSPRHPHRRPRRSLYSP